MIEPQSKAAYHPEAHAYLAKGIQDKGILLEIVYKLHSFHRVTELGLDWLLLFASANEYRGTSLLVSDCRPAIRNIQSGETLTQVVSRYVYPAPFFGRHEQLVLAVLRGNDRNGEVLFETPGFSVDRYRQGFSK